MRRESISATVEEVGVRQLKNEASRLIRRVREDGAEFVITVHGRPVAHLKPITKTELRQIHERWADEWIAGVEEVAEQIAKYWPEGVSAEEAVREQRREL